ncbi:AAA family ATPase, partial [Micromonospora sp. b486]|nr:AAA family ATPase [Micromonospora sp. b486]
MFAGSGSGKTVLIRRLIEECALRGVSAIVLDPNNDLARLGEAWPEPPPGWGRRRRPPRGGVSGRHRRGRLDAGTAGRSAVELPAVAGLRRRARRPDGFTSAVNAAVATLAPHARVDGGT